MPIIEEFVFYKKVAIKTEATKELTKEEKTISQLATELGVHPVQLKEWKKIAL